MPEVWVFVREFDGAPTPLALELLTKARQMGDTTAVYVGTGSEEAFARLGEYGAKNVLLIDPKDSLVGAPVARAMAERLETDQPDLILFGQAYDDRDVAGRLAARIGRPILSNATDVTLDGSTSHEIFGGTQIAEAEITAAGPKLVLIRPKSFAAEPMAGGAPQVSVLDLPDVGGAGAKVTGTHVEEREGPKLEDAVVIVSGGRGLGSAENYELIEKLGKLLGAA
ncbi:MAG TPA: FAD-binding protein, partial [Acidimicrobiia bacterium]|nr:FAD-binding protein [Acidimicrobiia bacterium]